MNTPKIGPKEQKLRELRESAEVKMAKMRAMKAKAVNGRARVKVKTIGRGR